MPKFVLAALVVLLTAIPAKGQDSLKTILLNNFKINFEATAIYNYGGSSSFEAPDFHMNPVFTDRTSSGGYDDGIKYMNDAPTYHGSSYFIIGGETEAYGASVKADLLCERRGISYGVFNTKETIVFPRLNLAYEGDFELFGFDCGAGLSVGYYDDARFMEGLTVYNMDVQGSDFFVRFENIKVSYKTIGDMVAGIGLDIDDGHYFIVSAEDIELLDGWEVDWKASNFLYSSGGSVRNGEYGYTFSLGVKKDAFKVYAEYGYRPDEYYKSSWKSAFLGGAEYSAEFFNRLDVDLRAEYRYYGFYFNQGYADYDVSYRPADEDASYCGGGTIGDYLYPLYMYFRPFSQWAVFTEIQDKNVFGYVIQAKASWRFWKSFVLSADLDANYLRPSNEEGFWYPFYDVGIGFEPFENCRLLFSRSNKVINLDKHYPTFYLIPDPTTYMTFQMEL